ncbi:MAG: glycosyltransferase family 2 protein [Eubacterium sp.]|nr:glycosyltransferase family 2 protein [Eubacterium sp.]
MKITGGVVTYNNKKTIERCISSVLKMNIDKEYDFCLYVYDNGSTDGTPELIESKFPNVKLIRNTENKGFGAGHNAIIKRVKSDYHFVINPDIYLDDDTIAVLADVLGKDESIGLITPRIMNNDGTEQFLPKYCPTVRYVFISKIPGFKYLRRRYTRQEEALNEPTEIEFCTGCFFGARTSYLRRMKGFSNHYFMYCEDSDLSRRVRMNGKKIIFYPEVTAYHNWQRDNTGNLRGIYRFVKSLVVYFRKWGFAF